MESYKYNNNYFKEVIIFKIKMYLICIVGIKMLVIEK